MSTQLQFFATREDILAICLSVEGRTPLDYARAGRYSVDAVQSFSGVDKVPSFGIPRSGSATRCDQFLAVRRGSRMVLRKAGSGGVGYVLDQFLNTDSVVVAPGGVWEDTAVISGKVATISESPFSKSLIGLFRRQMRAQFERIRAFWVGPSAAELLDVGKRLTMSIDSPAEYDLRR